MRIHATGFEPGCGVHALRLLPMVDFSWSFRCDRCGGTASMSWDRNLVGKTADECGKHCADLLGKILMQEVEYVGTVPVPDGGLMQALADGLERNGLPWAWMCPEGCGCRLYTNDADKRECGCDGECAGQEDDGEQETAEVR